MQRLMQASEARGQSHDRARVRYLRASYPETVVFQTVRQIGAGRSRREARSRMDPSRCKNAQHVAEEHPTGRVPSDDEGRRRKRKSWTATNRDWPTDGAESLFFRDLLRASAFRMSIVSPAALHCV